MINLSFKDITLASQFVENEFQNRARGGWQEWKQKNPVVASGVFQLQSVQFGSLDVILVSVRSHESFLVREVTRSNGIFTIIKCHSLLIIFLNNNFLKKILK